LGGCKRDGWDGLRQGAEAQIGGTVDMEYDVYMEFDEE
jgi:hypothetical protein